MSQLYRYLEKDLSTMVERSFSEFLVRQRVLISNTCYFKVNITAPNVLKLGETIELTRTLFKIFNFFNLNFWSNG